MRNLIIFGAGGHAISCLDVITSTKKYKIKGYVSKRENKSLSKTIKWLGNDQYINKIKKTDYAIIAFANIGKKNLNNRIKIYNKLKKKDVNYQSSYQEILIFQKKQKLTTAQ